MSSGRPGTSVFFQHPSSEGDTLQDPGTLPSGDKVWDGSSNSATNLLTPGKKPRPSLCLQKHWCYLLPTKSSRLCSPCNAIHSFYLMSVQKARLDEHPSICAFFVETGPGF